MRNTEIEILLDYLKISITIVLGESGVIVSKILFKHKAYFINSYPKWYDRNMRVMSVF